MNTIPESPQSSTSFWIPAVSLSLLALALLVSAVREEPAKHVFRARSPQPADYQADWRRNTNIDLSRTLATAQVGDCNEMAYRPHKLIHGQYLVYCTADGRQWSAWLVTTDSQRAVGPYPPDPLIPLPQ